MKKNLLFCLVAISLKVSAQTHLDQNGIQTTVIKNIATISESAKRYLVAELGYNSHHWQYGGAVIIEMYSPYYTTGYQKFIVECSYNRGTTGTSPKVSMLEAYGEHRSSRVVLGTPINLGTSTSGADNLKIPIYIDVRFYAQYNVKITYMQNRVNILGSDNQIKIYETPIETMIDDFSSPQIDNNFASTGSLLLEGDGTSYVMGNLGVGTKTPREKLSVNGKIRAKEIKVELVNWPDYVFDEGYKMPSLEELEIFIKRNKHLPGIPSASEVEKNGVELGEMNSILLKKIEELTLIVIEQQKSIKRLLDKIPK